MGGREGGVQVPVWIPDSKPGGDTCRSILRYVRRRHTSTKEAVVAASIRKGGRVAGAARARLTAEVKRQYETGASVRSIAETIGRSPTFVRQILREAGVILRSSKTFTSVAPREDAHKLLDQIPAEEVPAVIEHLRKLTRVPTSESGQRKFRTIGVFDGEPDLGAR